MNHAAVSGEQMEKLLAAALVGHSCPKATGEALLRNHEICKALGGFSPANAERLRRGFSPIIERGPYIGEILEVDHILPVSRFPQYELEFWNLELMPQTLNRKKGNKIGARQAALLERVRKGLK